MGVENFPPALVVLRPCFNNNPGLCVLHAQLPLASLSSSHIYCEVSGTSDVLEPQSEEVKSFKGCTVSLGRYTSV